MLMRKDELFVFMDSIYIITDNVCSKFTLLDCVTRELIASGGPMVTGQSVMAAQNRRL